MPYFSLFRQGVIKLNTSGEFFIANEGKRAMFVDGRPVKALLYCTLLNF